MEVLMKSGLPENSEHVQEAIEATRNYLREECWDHPLDLLWCLNSLKSAGLNKNHSLVKEIFEQLTALRNNDGGWSNEDIEGKIQSQTDPLFTKNVLHTLRAYELI